MQPAVYALDIYRGDSGHWQFKLFQRNNQPVDLTGVTPKAEIRDRPAGIQVTLLRCVITLPNIIDVTIDPEKSHGLPQSKGVWDLQLTYSPIDVRTVIAGPVTITQDVTDSTQPHVEPVSHRV